MPTKKIPTDEDAPALGHRPFDALQGLRATLPQAPSPTPPIVAPALSPAAAAFLDKVVVRHERKGHGGKTVTVIAGVAPSSRTALCAELKKAFGCGARVEGDDLVLQGELVDRTVTILQARGARRVIRGS
jgi:translation initiation factor 1 (eIF-1/SUI1)